MEQFSLEKWLQDKSHKVVTKTGEEVKIIDTNAPDENNPIIGYIYHKQKWNGPWSWHIDGTYKAGGDDMDLFFADEKNELNEFEKQLGVYIYYPKLSCEFDEEEKKYIRDAANTLLDLARKELESNYYDKVLDDKIVFKSELHATDLQTAYDMGKQDAFKDLPKWKKFLEEYEELDSHVILLEDNERVVLTEYLEKGDYYIELSDLKTLPKEE